MGISSGSERSAVDLCQEWFKIMILGENLCPYAEKPNDKEWIRWSGIAGSGVEGRLKAFLLEEEHLLSSSPSKIQTSIIVMEEAEESFENFYDFVGACEDLLEEAGAAAELQAVAFHPLFRFEDSKPGDPSVFVNRSPAPLIHLLRQEDLKAIDPEQGAEVSHRNGHHLEELGLPRLKEMLGHLLPARSFEE